MHAFTDRLQIRTVQLVRFGYEVEQPQQVIASATIEFLVDEARECLVKKQSVWRSDGMFVQRHVFQTPIFTLGPEGLQPYATPQWVVAA